MADTQSAGDKSAYLAEAYKRGLLPPDMKSAYEEAQKRGLLGSTDALQEGRRGGSAREVPTPDELDTQKKVDDLTKQMEALDAQGVDKLDPRYKKLLKERYTAKQYTPQGREDTTKNLAAGELGGVHLGLA